MSFFSGLSAGNNKTFKPSKKIFDNSKQYHFSQYADAVLGSGNLQKAVVLPEGEDADEWIATHCVDFYNQINMLYGTVLEFCTAENCPVMMAGGKYEYHWSDDSSKKPLKLSAPEYVDNLMKWTKLQLDDESLFPSKPGVPFPKTFRGIIIALGEEPHLNTSLKHFILFANEFGLVDKKEYAPLEDFIKTLIT